MFIMIKVWYTQTSRDQWGPIFFFWDEGKTYRLRLAGNPILLLEAYYNKFWWTEFIKTYKLVSEWNSLEANPDNLKALSKAKKSTKDFMDSIIELQKIKKSLLVIYKE